MNDEQKLEQKLQEKGLNAPRLSPEKIDAVIKDKTFTVLPSGKTMICELTLQNGFSVRGESSCVSPENFNEEIGQEVSFKDARDKVWQLEAYLLQQQYPCRPQEDTVRYLFLTANTSSSFLKKMREHPSMTGNAVRAASPLSLRGFHHKGPLRILIDSLSRDLDDIVDAANCCCTGPDQKVIIV